MLCGSQMRPILCLMILTSYLMVRGSIRGAKEAPPPSGPQPVEAGKNIPGRIIWRVEYERREKRKRQKEKNEKEKEGEGKRVEKDKKGEKMR